MPATKATTGSASSCAVPASPKAHSRPAAETGEFELPNPKSQVPTSTLGLGLGEFVSRAPPACTGLTDVPRSVSISPTNDPSRTELSALSRRRHRNPARHDARPTAD